MAQVYLNVGSNIERQHNICAGLDALQQRFGVLSMSSVYESVAVGFQGNAFFNLAVAMDTELSVAELAFFLRQLEYARGRPAHATRFSSRTLDIDILLVDDLVGNIDGVQLPRAEILANAHVLCPLAELAPAHLHPLTATSYAELWAQHWAPGQRVWKVDFCWRGTAISHAEG